MGSLAELHAHPAPAGPLALGLALFQGVRGGRRGKLQVRAHCRQPEAILVRKKVASSLPALAFEEWCGSEVFQTAARGHEGLPSSLVPSPCVLPGQQTELGLRRVRTTPDPVRATWRAGPNFTFFLRKDPRKSELGSAEERSRGRGPRTQNETTFSEGGSKGNVYTLAKSLKQQQQTGSAVRKRMALHLDRLGSGVVSRPHVPLLSVLCGRAPGTRVEGAGAGAAAGAHHQERVPDPEAPPGAWARGDGLVLAVQRHGGGRGLAHGTAADVRADGLLGERRHGQRRGAGQPVGPVVPAAVVAHLVDVAVGEGQRAKHGKARPCQTLGGKTRQCGGRAAGPLCAGTVPAGAIRGRPDGRPRRSRMCGGRAGCAPERVCHLPGPGPALLRSSAARSLTSRAVRLLLAGCGYSSSVPTKLLPWLGWGDGGAFGPRTYSTASSRNEKERAPGLRGGQPPRIIVR